MFGDFGELKTFTNKHKEISPSTKKKDKKHKALQRPYYIELEKMMINLYVRRTCFE